MASVEFGRADLSLWSDPGATKVYIPRLTSMPRRRARMGTTVQFAGDAYPTLFRGDGRMGSFDLSCRYGPDERHLAVALVHLIDEIAPAAADSRLMLRTHLEPTANLTAAQLAWLAAGAVVAVSVFEVTETPLEMDVLDLSFSATIVQHSLDTA